MTYFKIQRKNSKAPKGANATYTGMTSPPPVLRARNTNKAHTIQRTNASL